MAKKTKILPFNVSKKYDFLPQLYFPGGEPLEVVYSTRLLGVTPQSDLKWESHVSDITKRATSKLWILVRFKQLGGSINQMTKVYEARIRSTLEFAPSVFFSSITKDQSSQIELVQKKALAIILDVNYNSYESALS